MGWVRWLKALADRLPDEDVPAGKATPAARRPAARRGGDAYAKEWTRVLEDTGRTGDPNSTYTWDLQTNAPATPARARPKAPDAFDTYTWEVSESASPDDPWGLKKPASEPAAAPDKASGMNPYDTGVFNASWTGRFDQR